MVRLSILTGINIPDDGDELPGDPPQEEQGLNSVFDTDSTKTWIMKKNVKE